MRIVSFRDATQFHVGAERNGKVFPIHSVVRDESGFPSLFFQHSLVTLIEHFHETGLAAEQALLQRAPETEWMPLDQVTLLAPIPRPGKNIFCIGRNYAEHAAESLRAVGQHVALPSSPNVFTKAPTAVIGPDASIPHDAPVSAQLDWEVELGVVIGRGGRHIAKEDALSPVFGYTIVNDISARDIQHRLGMQWFLGKSLDGSCPMGPVIVTANEIPDPQALAISLTVNGVLKQHDSTANMLFSVAEIIVELSRYLTLEPGDLIATGTPAGVGFARTPPEFLQPGDTVEAHIERIGMLRNTVVAAEH